MSNQEYWNRMWAGQDFKEEEEGPKAGDEYLYPEVIEAISLIGSSPVIHLEAGCGVGIWNFLLHRGFREITSVGIDLAPCVLELGKYTRQKAYKHTYFAQSDIRYLPFADRSFSFITCFGVIEHFKNPQSIVREFHRVLKKGGILFLDTPNHGLWERFNRLFPIEEDEAYYSPEELAEISEKAGLKVLKKKAVGFSNSVMTPLYHVYDYNPDSPASKLYHLMLRPLKTFLKLFDPWLDASMGFYSIVVARK